MSENKDKNKQPRRRMSLFSFLIELVIDLALMGMGALLYYHFQVYPLGPVDLSPVVVKLFGGSKLLAVLTISLVPFGIGALNLLRTLYRAFIKR
jgi:hypothetical protein